MEKRRTGKFTVKEFVLVTNSDDFEVRHPRCVEPKLLNGKKYSQNTTICIIYDCVYHIAVYSYMFRPLSAIVRLYYVLL